MSFENLISDLEELAALRKAHSEPDGDEGLDNDNDGDDDSDKDGDETLGKSMSVTLDNGEQIDAVDGTELVKSLVNRLDTADASHAEKFELMQKSMGMAVDMIKSQETEIAKLRDLVKSFGNSGAGRKTTVSIAEKPEIGQMQKSEAKGMSGHEFLAKAEGAMKAGRITGLELSIAEASLNRGAPVREDIVNRVIG